MAVRPLETNPIIPHGKDFNAVLFFFARLAALEESIVNFFGSFGELKSGGVAWVSRHSAHGQIVRRYSVR